MTRKEMIATVCSIQAACDQILLADAAKVNDDLIIDLLNSIIDDATCLYQYDDDDTPIDDWDEDEDEDVELDADDIVDYIDNRVDSLAANVKNNIEASNHNFEVLSTAVDKLNVKVDLLTRLFNK